MLRDDFSERINRVIRGFAVYIVGFPEGPEKIFLAWGRGRGVELGYHCISSNTVSKERKNLVCILLGISPASDCGLPTFRNPLSVPSLRAGCKV